MKESDLVDAGETVALYDEILRLSIEQSEAIKSGDLDRLLSLLAQRGVVIASLPAEPNGAWEQARRQQIVELDGTHEEFLLAWREQVVAEIEGLRRGQTGLEGYRAYAPVDTIIIDRTC